MFGGNILFIVNAKSFFLRVNIKIYFSFGGISYLLVCNLYRLYV